MSATLEQERRERSRKGISRAQGRMYRVENPLTLRLRYGCPLRENREQK